MILRCLVLNFHFELYRESRYRTVALLIDVSVSQQLNNRADRLSVSRTPALLRGNTPTQHLHRGTSAPIRLRHGTCAGRPPA